MAISITSTGSQATIVMGTHEEVANYIMTGSCAPVDIQFGGFPTIGSVSIFVWR